MKKAYKKGFTLIEVLLFVAITTALFVGVAAGTYGSIYQQRFMDSTQNFAEFLRSVYSEATNTQFAEGSKDPTKAQYGKVITFEKDGDGGNIITVYSLVADAKKYNCGYNTPKEVLGNCLRANMIMADKKEDGTLAMPIENHLHTAGYVRDYTVRWNAWIQTNDGWDDARYPDPGFDTYEGIIVITRSPDSGNLFTYVLDKTRDGDTKMMNNGVVSRNDAVDMIIDGIKTLCDSANGFTGNTEKVCYTDPDTSRKDSIPNPFAYKDTSSGTGAIKYYLDEFDSKTVEFCINPNGDEETDLRRNVRIIVGAHNASGVEIAKDEVPPEDFDWTTYEGGNEYTYQNDNNYNLCKQ